MGFLPISLNFLHSVFIYIYILQKVPCVGTYLNAKYSVHLLLFLEMVAKELHVEGYDALVQLIGSNAECQVSLTRNC